MLLIAFSGGFGVCDDMCNDWSLELWKRVWSFGKELS